MTTQSADDLPNREKENMDAPQEEFISDSPSALPSSALGRGGAAPNAEKDPDEWTTGDEPMTGPQHSYLKTLTHEAKVELDETLTKAEASKKIDELQKVTGRGK